MYQSPQVSSITLKHTQSYCISEQPSKLVVPVPDKAPGTHQVKVDTHSPIHDEVEHKKHPKKAESDSKHQIMTNTTSHNGCQKAQIRAQNKTISLYCRANKEGQLTTNRMSR